VPPEVVGPLAEIQRELDSLRRMYNRLADVVNSIQVAMELIGGASESETTTSP
jgi:hypothetical protein